MIHNKAWTIVNAMGLVEVRSGHYCHPTLGGGGWRLRHHLEA